MRKGAAGKGNLMRADVTRRFPGARAGCLAVLLLLGLGAPARGAGPWSPDEARVLRSLWLESLPPLPADPSNAYEQRPGAVELGRKIFFDTRFSADGKVSCGTCHRPDYDFTDDLPLARGMGTTARRTMPLPGTAYFPWLFWDGRKDSLWAQALGPIEARLEHGISRTRCAHLISDHYRAEYEAVFGALPEFSEKVCPPLARPDPSDVEAFRAWQSMPKEKREQVTRVFVNMGKAVAAYVRRIVPGTSRFDRYVAAVVAGSPPTGDAALSEEETAGLRLFIGAAGCVNCHNGPLFTNAEFHAVGVPPRPGAEPDPGRAEGIPAVRDDAFNCLGPWSDAPSGDCAELRFMDTDAEKYRGAFKTPSLRNVATRPPYMHAGQFTTLAEVLRFYRDTAPSGAGHGGAGHAAHAHADLGHGNLTDRDLARLEAFLKTLSGGVREVP